MPDGLTLPAEFFGADDAGFSDPAEATPLGFTMLDDVEPVWSSRHLVDDLLTEGSFAVLYGESNSGKTFLATDIALHVATGRDWRGREVEQGGVVYVAAEGGTGLRNRLSAWKAHHAVNEAPFAVVPSGIDLSKAGSDGPRVIATAEALAKRTGMPTRLIVIDTLSRALAGGDENSSADMGAFVRAVDQIREATGAAVLVVHHSGKDTSRGARGHSLLRAAVDTEIEVQTTEDSPARTAVVRKQRDVECTGEFGFTLEVIELGEDDRGKPVRSCVPVEAQPVQPKRNRLQRLTPEQQAFKDEVANAVAKHGQKVRPDPDGPEVVAVSRNRLATALTGCGFFPDDLKRNQIAARLSKYVNTLKGKQILASTREWVWFATAQPSRNHAQPVADFGPSGAFATAQPPPYRGGCMVAAADPDEMAADHGQ